MFVQVESPDTGPEARSQTDPDTGSRVGPVDEAVTALTAVTVDGLDGTRAADLTIEVRRLQARLAGLEARLVRRVDVARPWAEAGYLNTASWLADSDNTSLDEARDRVRVARRLESMPVTAAALGAGEITAAHARRLAQLNAPDTAEAFAQAEEFLLGQARTQRWCDFTKAAAYWLRAARRDTDPDPDRDDRAHRGVSLHDGLRGTGLLTGELTPTGKAEVREALRRIEQELFDADWAAAKAIHGDATTTAHLARTPAQRRHDALVEMARRSATAPADGKRPKPLLTILAGENALADVLEITDGGTGTLISPTTVAAQLADAMIEGVLFDGPSRVLHYGRARLFTGALRRTLEIVHRHCTGRGCHVPAARCEMDHLVPWARGGLTTQDNGAPKCRAHHRQTTPTRSPGDSSDPQPGDGPRDEPPP